MACWNFLQNVHYDFKSKSQWIHGSWQVKVMVDVRNTNFHLAFLSLRIWINKGHGGRDAEIKQNFILSCETNHFHFQGGSPFALHSPLSSRNRCEKEVTQKAMAKYTQKNTEPKIKARPPLKWHPSESPTNVIHGRKAHRLHRNWLEIQFEGLLRQSSVTDPTND